MRVPWLLAALWLVCQGAEAGVSCTIEGKAGTCTTAADCAKGGGAPRKDTKQCSKGRKLYCCTDECVTPINKYEGKCIAAQDCEHATFSLLCSGLPANVKCCVKQKVKKPVVRNPPVTLATFRKLFPELGRRRRSTALLPYFQRALQQIMLKRPPKNNNQRCWRMASFSAQVHHETGGLLTTDEVSNGLKYNNNKALGNTKKGDGPRFKGRGALQLTGRYNYGRAAKALKRDYLVKPEKVAFPGDAFDTGVWFWNNKKLSQHTDIGTKDAFIGMSEVINGKDITASSVAARVKLWKRAMSVFKCAAAPKPPVVKCRHGSASGTCMYVHQCKALGRSSHSGTRGCAPLPNRYLCCV